MTRLNNRVAQKAPLQLNKTPFRFFAAVAIASALISISASAASILVTETAQLIEKFSPDGVGAAFNNTLYARGIAFDSAGNLYVTDEVRNQIIKFTSGGIATVFADASDGLNTPGALAFDDSGNLFVANNPTIQKFTPDGVPTLFASGLGRAEGLAFDSVGNLYAANFGNNTITKFAPDGTDSVFANTGLNGPGGLAFDNSDNLYVANFNGNTIERFTPSGTGSLFATLARPSGLAFDTAENVLYVAEGANRTIKKFTGDGASSQFANMRSFPYLMTIEPTVVPEPGTVVMLILGTLAITFQRERSVRAVTPRD